MVCTLLFQCEMPHGTPNGNRHVTFADTEPTSTTLVEVLRINDTTRITSS